MFPIAGIVSHSLMRRSLVGALVTDPVVPESRRPVTRAHVALVTHAHAVARLIMRPDVPTLGRSDRRHATHANEGAQNT